jgi:hypothetical protein
MQFYSNYNWNKLTKKAGLTHKYTSVKTFVGNLKSAVSKNKLNKQGYISYFFNRKVVSDRKVRWQNHQKETLATLGIDSPPSNKRCSLWNSFSYTFYSRPDIHNRGRREESTVVRKKKWDNNKLRSTKISHSATNITLNSLNYLMRLFLPLEKWLRLLSLPQSKSKDDIQWLTTMRWDRVKVKQKLWKLLTLTTTVIPTAISIFSSKWHDLMNSCFNSVLIIHGI